MFNGFGKFIDEVMESSVVKEVEVVTEEIVKVVEEESAKELFSMAIDFFFGED